MQRELRSMSGEKVGGRPRWGQVLSGGPLVLFDSDENW
jgi:hypothetical protein